MVAGAGEPSTAAVGDNSTPRIEDGRASDQHLAGSTPFSAKPLWEVPGRLEGVRVVEKEKREWNTKAMGQRMMVDAACAATAGGLVAPLITTIDK